MNKFSKWFVSRYSEMHKMLKSLFHVVIWLIAILNLRRNVQHYEFILKVHTIRKSSFCKTNILTPTAHQYWGKVSKIFDTFYLYLQLLAIMNLMIPTLRLKNFMTSCRDKLYHHTISNRIKFNFLIILFDKMFSSKNLCLRLALSQKLKEWLTSKIRLVNMHSWTNKIKSSSCLWQQF